MTDRRDPEAVVYPGAPLRAVAIEVGFPPLLDAFPRFAKFQRRHHERFNGLLETSTDDTDGESVPDGHEFARPRTAVLMGQDSAVTIAKDQLAVITYQYATGFSGFLKWAMPLMREGFDDLGVDRITRVSFRYENRIKHDTAKLDLGSIIKISLPAPGEAARAVRHVHLHWDQVWEGGKVTVEIHGCGGVSPDEIHMNITAHQRATSGGLDEIEGLTREAHRRARLTFEELITSAFRERLQSPPQIGSVTHA